MKRLALLAAALLVACANGETSPPSHNDARVLSDGGADASPDALLPEHLALTAINPTGGSQEGGTTVTLVGTGFEEGATVHFGDAQATGVTIGGSHSARATAPAGAGVVTVKITNPDGESKALVNAYTYREPDVDAVDWCAIQHPPALQVAPGEQAGPIFARVYEASCTEGEGVCGRVVAELGYGPLDVDAATNPGGWTWAPAAVNPAHTEDNDEYMASLTVGLPGDYGYAFRMRINEGHWTYCDLDGTDNGFQMEQVGQLSVQEGVQSIGWCALQAPAAISIEPGQETEGIYGRLFVEGCTENEAHCEAVVAELGWGDPQVDPSATPEAWHWQAATYNEAHTGDANDEHSATLTPAETGAFAYAYRVSLGDTWTYCDLDGSDNGFQLDQAGQLTVAEDTVEVAWCVLQFPASVEAAVEQPVQVFGRALVAGCTDGDAQCPVLQGQVGYGLGDDPAAFEWVDAAYNAEHTDDDNDEHIGEISVIEAGSYHFAFRFSVDGANWTVCDLDSSENGVAADQLGTLTVADPVRTLDWCQLRFPASVDLEVGEAMPLVYARALVSGCTEGDLQCPVLRGQLGVAAVGGAPQWIDGEYNAAHTADANDEWQATLPALEAGEYRYWYRFSADGGDWVECDLDSSENGFEMAQAGSLTLTDPVVEPPMSIGWCEIQHPPAISTAPGVSSTPIYGRVFVEGCTEGEGRCEAVVAQVGYGPHQTLPSADWTWGPAEHNAAVVGDNDEHAGVITIADAGVYGYGVRYSVDGEATWTYCDLNGADGELLLASVPQATVAAREIAWCNIQFPAELVGSPGDGVGPVYSRVFVEGCTEMDAQCSGLRMQVGLGAAGSDPREGDWRWFEGNYNPEHVDDNNDEYAASVELSDGQGAFVVRLSGDGGGTWVYCDLDGGEFSLEQMGTISAP